MKRSRRDLLRWLGLGVLLSGAAALVLRRPRSASESCVNAGLCRGCQAYAGCGLPTALSMKTALRDGQAP
jgi:hypothetical protein